ncbi:hypothetical protein GOBAR_AA03060 [Gossypium barbadense]|uniref:DUF7795 domain-containing protein n=1 Tax=Gossypium barbadense TaxID=3634 RepID=A0A2P5YPR8_GOSBA|nr:hypothetical protein GOBAR_AA03060 [Gossypium barbadense]
MRHGQRLQLSLSGVKFLTLIYVPTLTQLERCGESAHTYHTSLRRLPVTKHLQNKGNNKPKPFNTNIGMGALSRECPSKNWRMPLKVTSTRVAKLDELVPVGGRLLTGFQQGLEFLRRPPIKKTSKLIENILKANETKRLNSYLEAGCINSHDRVENTSKLKSILNELECLLGVATAALQMANEHLSPLMDMESVVGLDPQESSGEDEMTSSRLREPEVTDYAAVMGIIYSMVKQDYTMQHETRTWDTSFWHQKRGGSVKPTVELYLIELSNKIVTSLNLKSSSEELESYSLMWSLRPYVNDQTMKLAWKLVP